MCGGPGLRFFARGDPIAAPRFSRVTETAALTSAFLAIERAVDWAARALCLLAAAALAVLMVAVTVADVLLRLVGAAIPGAFELVTLGMRIAVPLAMPYAFWIGGHVAVDVVTVRLPARWRWGAGIFALALSGATMVLLTWASFRRAVDAWRYGDVTADLGWPVIGNWIPLVAGAGLCVPVIAVLLVRRVATGVAEPAARNEP